MKKPDRRFMNKVIKQGNSLCVRIPSKVARQLNIKENSVIMVYAMNMDNMASLHPSLLQAYQKIPALKKYSLNEIAKYTLAANVEKASGKKTNKNSEYQKFMKIVRKNKKQIRKNILASDTYKKQMKMLEMLKKSTNFMV
jgi:antitoxin component of MazEF toxin-antitoxin module